MNTIIPPYLHAGDSIGIVAPGAGCNSERISACVQVLSKWGYKVKMGDTLQKEITEKKYFSAPDEERLADLQTMFDADDIKCVLCVRGGFGISRFIDRIDFSTFLQQPKWVTGFSDVTMLHCHLQTLFDTASIHSPMETVFSNQLNSAFYLKTFKDAIEGRPLSFRSYPHHFNRIGTTIAPLVGGNLSLLTHLIGTCSDLNTHGKILFLEEVSEDVYKIDRMILQLKRSGKLDGLSGLIIGSFSAWQDTFPHYGKTPYEIIKEHVRDYQYPVCFGFPIGHDVENISVKVGGTYELNVSYSSVTLSEITSSYDKEKFT